MASFTTLEDDPWMGARLTPLPIREMDRQDVRPPSGCIWLSDRKKDPLKRKL